MKNSTADAVITMDADGEHPPELIPEMIERYLAGADIVQCVRRMRRMKKFHRKTGSFIFNKLARILTGINLDEQNVYFRLLVSEIRDQMLKNKRWLYFMRLDEGHFKRFSVDKVYFDVEISSGRASKFSFWRLAALAFTAVLSMTSGTRFTCIAVSVLLCALLGYLGGLHVIAMMLVLLMAIVSYKYVMISTKDILALLEVVESNPPKHVSTV
jgi:dolichol-phosphate mannosyltransferase